MRTVLNIAGMIEESIADGPGFRLVVFAQGCRHKCEGCHNPETHTFAGGMPMTVEEILMRLEENPMHDGITLSGGDPFEQAEGFSILAKAARHRGYHVMTYTGYTFEAIQNLADERPGWNALLTASDVLVDGPFKLSEKCGTLLFRGSRNQRLIDVDTTLKTGKVNLYSTSVGEQAS